MSSLPFSFRIGDFSSVAGIFGVLSSLTSMVGLALYVIFGIAILKLCGRFGLRGGWMGFVPIVGMYKMGDIAEHICALRGMPKKYKGKILGLSIAILALCVLIIAGTVGLVLSGWFYVTDLDREEYIGVIVLFSLALLLTIVAMLVLGIVLSVFEYIAMYQIFSFLAPRDAVAFEVLSILFPLSGLFLLIAACKQPEPIACAYPGAAPYGTSPFGTPYPPQAQQPVTPPQAQQPATPPQAAPIVENAPEEQNNG